MGGEKGFTLIEVLASLVILALVALTIFSFIPGAFRALNIIAERTEVIYEARGLLNREIRIFEKTEADEELVIAFNPAGEEEKEIVMSGELLKNEEISDEYEVVFVYYYPVLTD